MSPWFVVEAEGTAHEFYEIEAETPLEAREKFERGEVGDPFNSWADGMEVLSVTSEDAALEE